MTPAERREAARLRSERWRRAHRLQGVDGITPGSHTVGIDFSSPQQEAQS